MTPEIPLNVDRPQQVFEGMLEHGEGGKILQESVFDETFRGLLGALIHRIDSNRYLEAAEKEQLKTAVLKQVLQGLSSFDDRLDRILLSQEEDTHALRQRLYTGAIGMVAEFTTILGQRIDSAADYYHIDEEEFKTEILGQVPYMRSGIPQLDKQARKSSAAGKPPRESMQEATTEYLGGQKNVFDYDLLSKRYPDLKLPEHAFSCLRIQGTENLRDPASGKVLRTASSAEVFQILEELPPQGKYTYALVLDKQRRVYKLCTNDKWHVLPLEYANGEYRSPQLEAGLDTSTLEEPLKTLVSNGYANTEGVLTARVNQLSVEKVLPAQVQDATIVINQRFNGPLLPQGVSVPITREGGTFVFAGEYAGLGRADKRVRIYAGDQVQFTKEPTASNEPPESEMGAGVDTGELMGRNHHDIPPSVAAYWRWMRSDWEAPNVIDRTEQAKAVCAAYVQRTLEGMYGHDFAKDIFVEDGHFVDAWELAGRIESSGYGHTAMDFSRHYEVDATRESINLREDNPGYKNDLDRMISLTARPESRTGVLFMHFKRTRANPKILTSLEDNGSLNSHAMLVLGAHPRTLNVLEANPSLASALLDSMRARLGESYDNSWEKNRYLLGTLKELTLNGIALTFDEGEFCDANGVAMGVNEGDSVSYQEVQVTDFYHNEDNPKESPARVVGLTETMIQGNFDPVKLSQWDGDVVNNKMETMGQGFIVGEFRVDASAADLPQAIRQQYEARADSDPGFLFNNPSADVYVKRSMDFLLYVHVINDQDALPVIGARIPIFDWSKKPLPPPRPIAKKTLFSSVQKSIEGKSIVADTISFLTS